MNKKLIVHAKRQAARRYISALASGVFAQGWLKGYVAGVRAGRKLGPRLPIGHGIEGPTDKRGNYSPCHAKPREQWCDRDGPGGFMGHTCYP